MKKFLFILHTSMKTGGGEDDLLRLLIYFKNKYEIIGVIPEGPRADIFTKYCSDYVIIPSIIFPFLNFNIKKYIKYFLVSIKKTWKLFPFFKRIRKNVDICFVNSSVCLNEIIMLKLFSIPFVLSIKERIEPSFVRKIIYGLYRRSAKKVIVISEYLKKTYDSGKHKNNSVIIYSSIDEDLYREAMKECENKNAESKSFTITNVGQIYPLKNQLLLINALKNINTANEIKINFIGKISDKNYYNNIKLEIEKSGLNNCEINFFGELDKKSTIRELIGSDCIIISSRQEGMSLVLLEALFLKKPLIATDVGIIGNVIKNGYNGFIIDKNSPEDLAEKILIIKNNPEIRERFINNSEETYKNFFNYDDYLTEHEKILFSDL